MGPRRTSREKERKKKASGVQRRIFGSKFCRQALIRGKTEKA